MLRHSRLIPWLFVCVAACADGEPADADQAPILPSALVAKVHEPCPGVPSAAEAAGRRAMREAQLHWERLPFDGSEGARAVHLARVAGACFEAAGLRAERRESEACLLRWEHALYLAVQSERRAFSRARANGRSEEAALHGARFVALLEPGNPATEPTRQAVLRWERDHVAAEEGGAQR